MTKFLNISTDNTLGGSSASDDTVSSQKAIKDYVDSHAGGSPQWGNITGPLSNQTDLQTALNAKANISLYNLNSTGKNIANWSSNVTNCITEIPQDIKLELNSNNRPVLKVGSKFYRPNGNGVFDLVSNTVDLAFNFTNTQTGKYFLCVTGNNSAGWEQVGLTGSGTSTEANNGFYYRTDDNKIYYQNNSSGNIYSFPLAIVTATNGVCVIDQVFNGFGYIGSTVFALPGVKGVRPTGRNADGTLKNIIVSISSVLVNTSSSTGTLNIGLNSNQIYAVDRYIYDETKNSNYNLSNNYVALMNVGTVVKTSGVITSLTPKTPFHAVDYNDFSDLSDKVSANTTAIASKANDSDVVKLTGNQSISGVKTMTGSYFKVGTAGSDTQGTLVGGSGNIELFSSTTATNGGMIDFHYAGSTADYTSRIIENVSGGLSINGNSFSKTSPCTVNTAPTDDNTTSKQIDTVGARNTKINDVLSALYPVGSVYIGTQATCPLSTLISGSTWTLVSSGKVLQGADNDHAAGTTIAAGLPNITGSLLNTYDSNASGQTGAFYNDSIKANNGFGFDGNSHSTVNATNFDASRSSSIYGNSSTVQPPAYVVNIWERTA